MVGRNYEILSNWDSQPLVFSVRFPFAQSSVIYVGLFTVSFALDSHFPPLRFVVVSHPFDLEYNNSPCRIHLKKSEKNLKQI